MAEAVAFSPPRLSLGKDAMSYTYEGSSKSIGDIGETLALCYLQCQGFCVTRSPSGSSFDLKAQKNNQTLIVEVKSGVALDKKIACPELNPVASTRYRTGFTFSQLDKFDLAVFVVFDYGKVFIQSFTSSVVSSWTFSKVGNSRCNAKRRRLYLYRRDWHHWFNPFELPIFTGQSKVSNHVDLNVPDLFGVNGVSSV